jgi:hypothetical protein
MNSVDRAIQTQLTNIQARTGKSLDELTAYVHALGLTKHGQIRDLLKRDFGLGYGDANTLAHYVVKATAQHEAGSADATPQELVNELYCGAKASLQPIHAALMAAIEPFGPFETAPKKSYVSLRRKKQFAMIGPATNTRVEVGLNVKELAPSRRLIEQPPGKMCQYIVNVSHVEEVDQELLGWIKQAYERAG